MAQDFLSQDEVDTLLRGVTGESEAPTPEPDPSGVRPYNLATQERIVRGRMPTLEIINERFGRLLRISLYNFVRRSAEITVGPVRVLKYGEFVRNLAVPANLNVVQVKPLRGTALFIFDPNLVFTVVDHVFGGDGRFHFRIEGREFTQTEQRIIQNILSLVFENYEASWKSVHPLKFEYVRAEMNTQFINIATPNEVVIATTFNIGFGSSGGDFHVCMPYSMLEPIRDLLYSSVQGEQIEADKRWVRLLSQQVQLAKVEIVANLGHTTINFDQILAMGTGDVIPLEMPPAVLAGVGGVPVMECRYGVANGRYALQVERMIHSAEDSKD